MRVMLILPGGADRHGRESIPAVLWLLERLARDDEVTVILLHQYPEPCTYRLLGCRVHNLGTRRSRFPGRFLGRCRELTRIAAGGHRPDVIHALWLGESSLLATVLGRVWRTPAVLSLGGGEMVWLPDLAYGSQGRWVNRARIRLSLRWAEVVTAGSRQALASLRHRDARWLPLGVDTGPFRAVEAAGEGPPWRLLHIADVNPVKDRSTLLAAAAVIAREVPDLRLDWLGFDTTDGAVRREIEARGLGGVIRYHGKVSHGEVVRFCSRAHLLIQTSRHESQGVAIMEGAMAGVPAVGTDVGVLHELAPAAGVAVPPGDARALAVEVVSLLRDHPRRRELGRAARAWAWTHDADWTADRFRDIYREVTSRQ